MIAHCVSGSVMRMKVASHLVTLNHSTADLGILKRQQALDWGIPSERPSYFGTACLFPAHAMDEVEADASEIVPFREGLGGALGSAAGACRAALSQGRIEGQPTANAAEDDAAGIFLA